MTDGLPFHLHLPRVRRSGVIFASPHSGRGWPAAVRARSTLPMRVLRSSEDAFVGHLILPARDMGAAVMTARIARGVVDLNRGADELDPALIEGVVPPPGNVRIASGLGVIPRVVGGGRVIHPGRITRAEAEARLAAVWVPWHDRLTALMHETASACGAALLIDTHSMPRGACGNLRPRPDIVLGDGFGRAAAPWVIDAVATAFVTEGFSVRRNTPFAGAYILARHGAPARERHALQVEIDRGLYMDEVSLRPLPGYGDFRASLSRVWARVAALIPADDLGQMAAE